MSRYIDRDKALSMPFANGEYDHDNANEHFIYGCETYKEWLEDLPIIEIVWCKECKHSRSDEFEPLWCYRSEVCEPVKADHFCGYGEGKDELDDLCGAKTSNANQRTSPREEALSLYAEQSNFTDLELQTYWNVIDSKSIITPDMRISVEEAIDILSRMSQNHFYGHRETEAMRMGAEALRKMDEVEDETKM